jgi:ribonucleoside-triphosphate reductase
MSIKSLMNYTFVSKYARWIPEKKRRETWAEAVTRVKQMMLDKYVTDDSNSEIETEIEWAYEQMLKKRVLGSQRALQFGGEPILKHNARIYNCITSYADRLKFFQECMFLLLCGCGTGFSVQRHHIAKLPKLIKQKSGSKKFTIPDSIEGWSDAVGVLVSSYFDQDELFPEYNGKSINFDYSLIRQAGSLLKSSGGKAPGPEPLKNALISIKKILDKSLKNADFSAEKLCRLTPIDAYDIVMYGADAVISGGVRRSATICVFSPDDEEMAKAKTGNWFIENPQRGRSNNSALLLRDETTKEQFSTLMNSVKDFGEPGFVWADSTELIVNPCVEIGMWPVDEDTGKTGWQACNLSTINCAKIKTKEDFYDACKAASIIGTFQAGFNDFDYLGETSEKIIKREALLGVSMTGIMEQHDICLDPEIQKMGADIVKKTNKVMAKKIGINQAARTTCIKPEGTSSCILGTSSGIHPHHAKRYIRRVQANKMEPIYNYFKEINPRACEESVWSNNDSDDVVSFCVEVPAGSKTKNKVGALDLLDYVKSTQRSWVIPGTNKNLCTQPWLVHNVSNTINVRPEEWDEVESYIYKHRKYFCGISLLPITGDKDYPQAPFTTIHLPTEQVSHYGDASLFVSGLIEVALNLWEDNLWAACDSLLGIGEKIKGNGKRAWADRCEKFANRYFDGDVRRLTYCMKDVHNWKEWVDLSREYVSVDYTNIVEEENNVTPEQEWACFGGVCEVS